MFTKVKTYLSPRWNAYWRYRRIMRIERARTLASSYLKFGLYTKAIVWLGRVQKNEFPRDATVKELLAPYLLDIIRKDLLPVSFDPCKDLKYVYIESYTCPLSGLCYRFEEFVALRTEALVSLKNLDLALKISRLIADPISNEELLAHSTLCLQRFDDEEAKRACKFIRGMTPLAAFKMCQERAEHNENVTAS